MIVWLSGPTGAGKTTISRLLRRVGCSIVEEFAPEDLFRAFASDPAANCEALQRCFMQARFEGWNSVSDACHIVFDRSIDEDVEVFCRMHMRAGLLTQGQFDALAQFGKDLQAQMPPPDFIVFVTAQPETLLKRKQALLAPAHVLDNLGTQISLYSEWLRGRTERVLELDTTRSNGATIENLFPEAWLC